MSHCSRVISTVRDWANLSGDISKTAVLADLWERYGQQGIPYCDDAASDLLRRLKTEFRNPPAVKLRLKTADFCPAAGACLKTVDQLCKAVDESEVGDA